MDDDILESFNAILQTEETNENEEESYYKDYYKNWGKTGYQEKRRQDLLQKQKEDRKNNLDDSRGISQLINEALEQEARRLTRAYQPNFGVPGFKIGMFPNVRNVLMLSEWLIDKPEDFDTKWLVVPCPKASRKVVVASQGASWCFSKYGRLEFNFKSLLPGGNRTDWKKTYRLCILDCFYHEKTNTMYVLDLLVWNSVSMTDGETEFRRYWLENTFNERPELGVVSKHNEIKFELLPMVPCKKDSFYKFMMSYPPFRNNLPPLDGLLFYHRNAQYIAGETPLVGWLYPFMVPEVLGEDIAIHKVYLRDKPADYINQEDFIKKFNENNNKKSNRKKYYGKMDTYSNTSNKQSIQAGPSGSPGPNSSPDPSHSSETANINETVQEQSTSTDRSVPNSSKSDSEMVEVSPDKCDAEMADDKQNTQ